MYPYRINTENLRSNLLSCNNNKLKKIKLYSLYILFTSEIFDKIFLYLVIFNILAYILYINTNNY